MKKLLYSFLALGLLATVSCKEDDDDNTPKPEPEPVVNNSVTYNGNSFSLDYGALIDWGSDGDHYNYDVFLTDGEIDFATNSASDASIVIYAELFSASSEEFNSGTFNYNASGNVEGKNYFETVQIILDSNDNGNIDEQDQMLNVTGGKVIATGDAEDFALELDVTLENGKSLKGKYSADFDYYDGTENERSIAGGRMTKSTKRGLR